MRFAYLSAVCALALATPALGGTLGYHPASPAYLNGTFDPTKPGDAYAPCLIRSSERSLDQYSNATPAPGQPAGGTALDTQFSIRSISSRQELYNYLNFSASVSGSYGFFSGSGSVGLEKESTFGEDTFSWIVFGYTSYGRFGLDNVQLNRYALEVKDNPVGLRARCGTDFVSQETRSVQAAAVFKIHNLTSSQRSVLTASISGGFGNGVLDVSGAAAYTNFVKQAAQSGQIEVSLYARGGKGITALSPIVTNYQDVNIVLSTFKSYFEGLTLNDSAPVSYNTGSLQALASKPRIETEFFNRYIAALWLEYEELAADRERIKSFLRQSDDFAITQTQTLDAKKQFDLTDAAMKDIAARAEACHDAFTDTSVGPKLRRVACNKSTAADLYAPSLMRIPAKPYKLSYWTGGTLTPGEEAISYDLTGANITSVVIVKQLSAPAPVEVNAVALTGDTVRHAGGIILPASFAPSDFPIGLKITYQSGDSYVERFAYTPAPPVPTTSPVNPAATAASPMTAASSTTHAFSVKLGAQTNVLSLNALPLPDNRYRGRHPLPAEAKEVVAPLGKLGNKAH